MLGYFDLATHYKISFALVQHHKYNLSEVENMVVYERDLYVGLLMNWIQEQKERAENV